MSCVWRKNILIVISLCLSPVLIRQMTGKFVVRVTLRDGNVNANGEFRYALRSNVFFTHH